MNNIIKENPILVFPKRKPEESFGMESSADTSITINYSFPQITQKEYSSEDDADIKVRRARENEPTRPMEDVFKDLGLDE